MDSQTLSRLEAARTAFEQAASDYAAMATSTQAGKLRTKMREAGDALIAAAWTEGAETCAKAVTLLRDATVTECADACRIIARGDGLIGVRRPDDPAAVQIRALATQGKS